MKTNDPALIGVLNLYCETHKLTDSAMNIEEQESEAQECNFDDDKFDAERSHE